MRNTLISLFILFFFQTPASYADSSVQLKNEASFEKYGIVTVFNEDGTFNREFKITKRDMINLHSGGSHVPAGVTREEWESGKVVVAGKGMAVGDIVLKHDGGLEIKYSEDVVNGRFVESYIQLSPGEWTGAIPNITVRQDALDGIKDPRGKLITKRKPTRIRDGVLTHQ